MNLDAAIAEINALSLDALRARWRKRYRRSAPVGLPPKLLRDAFIYALQEEAYGGLSPETRRRLDRLAARVEKDPDACVVGDDRLRPGARLMRDWGGARHEVEVLEKGFGYRGAVYSSLTEIATQITGVKWSGPRFFGLTKRKTT